MGGISLGKRAKRGFKSVVLQIATMGALKLPPGPHCSQSEGQDLGLMAPQSFHSGAGAPPCHSCMSNLGHVPLFL